MALPRKYRLSDKKDIDRVFKSGRTVKGSFLFIKLLDNKKGYSRGVFIVSSKYIPLAVDRNKIRRILSGEIARIPLLGRGHDMAIVIHRKIARGQFKKLAGELRETLSKMQSANIKVQNDSVKF